MMTKETLQKIAQAADAAFERAIKQKELSGKHEVEAYIREGDLCIDFFFTADDGTQWNPTILVLNRPRKYKDFEDAMFNALISNNTI